MGVARAVLGVLLLGFGCTPAQTYWTKQGAGEQAFRRTSRRCNERAQIQVFEEVQRSGCGDRGCPQSGPQPPFPEQAEKNRRERRRIFLYEQCLEARGWVRNYDGVGFEGR